jgi:hypothetical protein
MKPAVRIGLIVGLISLVITIFVAFLLGFCGPVVALIVGGVAGFLGARGAKPATRGDGAREGASAGAIAGGLTLIGQVIASGLSLALAQFSGLELPFGAVPDPGAEASVQALYYLSGLGAGCCFGLADVVAAALAGALAGYLGVPSQPATPGGGYSGGDQL